MMRKLGLAAVMTAAIMGAVLPKNADAGSGFYDYGVHFGLYDFFEDSGPLQDAEGGFAFGYKRGMYFIKSGFALGIDYLGFSVGLVGPDKDQWFVELPSAGIEVGTGFDIFMIYVGGWLSAFGLDGFGEDVAFSVLNPRAVGGLQVGVSDWGLFLRSEFQLGHTLRFGDEPNYTFTNIQFTLGYGYYSDFL
jgi:hypothetical protein